MPAFLNWPLSRNVVAACVVVTLVTAAGCGGTSNDPGAETATPPADAPAPEQALDAAPATPPQPDEDRAASAEGELRAGLRVLAQEWQQAAEGAAPVSHERLLEVLPDVPGWTRRDHRSERVNLPVPHATGRAVYERDGQTVSVEVTDTAMSQLLLSPFAMFLDAGFEERTDNGFIRATRVDEEPAFEEWDASRRRGEVVVVVGGRYLLKATGTNVPTIATVTGVVSRLRISRLEALR